MAKYSLDDVKALVQMALDGDQSKVWFSGRSRSIDYVIHVYQCTEDKAEHVVLRGLLKLKPDDFVKSVMMQPPPDLLIADEYGLEQYEGHNWYIKLVIEDDSGDRYVTSISFHPVERPLALANGKELEVTLDADKRPKKK
jgi:hypothetical protein